MLSRQSFRHSWQLWSNSSISASQAEDSRHIFCTADRTGSEPVCGQNRTGFYPGIILDHQQLVGELRRSLETLHKAGLECAQIAAHFVQQYTCVGKADKFLRRLP